MNILILGSGGREHALAWKIVQSAHCSRLWVAPGNPGTGNIATNLPIDLSDFEAIRTACIREHIDLLIVGPEEPLVRGLVDFLGRVPELRTMNIIGPSADAAQLEGSKAFAKGFMLRNQIPTARYAEFDSANYEEGVAYIRNHPLPVVLKADGLAAGKGVLICQSHIEALAEFELMIQQAKFGMASRKVVVEEFLSGIEMSLFVLTDGVHYQLLPAAKDYKRVGAADTGLNTGGMGAVSPVPFADVAFMEKVEERIVRPTINGIRVAGMRYQGVVFIGLINVNGDPFVIEYNCRFGDPETEVVLPRINNDLVELFQAISQQRIHEIRIEVNPLAAATVVAVSGGYPGPFEKGAEIVGLEEPPLEDSIVFHAGTVSGDNGAILTSGGRVLAVTSLGDDIKGAVQQSNYVLSNLHFKGMYYRKDIGFEFF